MKPAPFEYYAPSSVEEAMALLAESGSDAKLLAGGQSLVPAMNFRIMQPSVLIDLNRIQGLAYIEPDNDAGLRIGAMTRQSQVEHNQLVAERLPLLSQTLPLIAHPQIRNRGTVGGSLVHADPAAELPVVAVALGAELTIQGQDGERRVGADEFFEGMFTTAVGPQEILREVHFPGVGPRTGSSFQEVARRAGDYAMAGVAVILTVDESGQCERARIVYLNLGDGPVDAVEAAHLLVGEGASEELFGVAAEKATRDEIIPFGNVHATPEYQRHLAYVLTLRALKQAWRGAAGA